MQIKWLKKSEKIDQPRQPPWLGAINGLLSLLFLVNINKTKLTKRILNSPN